MKHKIRRKLLSVLLVACMAMTLTPAAFATEGDVTQGGEISTGETTPVESVNVATIGNQGYTTLEEAFKNVFNGQKIQLESDVTITDCISVTKTVTLDLNGHKITFSPNVTEENKNKLSTRAAFNMDTAGITFTIQDNSGNGSIESKRADNSNVIIVSDGELVVEGGTISNNWYVVYVSQSGRATIKGGTLESKVASALSTNGSSADKDDYSGNAVINVEGGTLISEQDVTIYVPAGTLNISGGNIKGATAVYAKSGITTITGGALSSESAEADFQHYPGGCAATGDAVVIEACDYPNGEPTVRISGGQFTSTNASAVAYYQYENHEAQEISISGGTFSSDVSSMVAENYECVNNNGTYTVQAMENKLAVSKPSVSGNTASATLEGNFAGTNTTIEDEDETNNSSTVTDNTVIVDMTTTESSPNVSTSQLTITQATAESLTSASALEVKTDVGTVELDATALGKISQANGAVVISITDNTTESEDNVVASYTVTVQSGENNLLPDGAANNGTVTITVDKPTSIEGNNLQAWYVVDGTGNSLIYVNQLATSPVGDKQIAITINHLSKIVLTNGTPSKGQAVASITKNGTPAYYATLDAAVDDAVAGDTILLRQDASVASQVKPKAGVTIDGNGHTLTYNGAGTESEPANQAFLNITNNNVTIKNLTVNATTIKHGVQFYCTEGGTLDNVNVNGGAYTSVQVNGSTGINITNSTMNPNQGAYANIEYSMGNGVTTIPSMSINNVSFSSNATSYIYADWSTTSQIDAVLTGEQSQQDILDKIQDNITYTSSNGGSLPITVLFGTKDNHTTVTIREESTYQPPYTGDYNYPVTIGKTEHGTVTIAKEDQWANDGEKITVTVTPDDAYMLDELVIKDKAGNELQVKDNGDGTYTFTMPEGAVTITAIFVEDPDWVEPEPEPEPSTDVTDIFNDVTPGAWYVDVVQYAYDHGLMTGTSATTFEPDTTTSRAMIVSILHRLEGSPSVGTSDFSDVASGAWYADPVAWAAENGIVAGFENGTFGPNDPITREQMASILYRYAEYKGIDTSARANLSAYSDQPSAWAQDVMEWANAEGLINGTTATTLDPQGTATRAQVAAMLQRFIENVL